MDVSDRGEYGSQDKRESSRSQEIWANSPSLKGVELKFQTRKDGAFTDDTQSSSQTCE